MTLGLSPSLCADVKQSFTKTDYEAIGRLLKQAQCRMVMA